jgi:anion-transporting  ArsA/GET3 family ATPase
MLDRRLLIVTGKGGVGKSAVTAALALAATRRGMKVLVVGMTDDLGLAQHLGARRLTYEARELRPGLHGMHVELSASLDEYLRIQLRIPRVPRFGPVWRAFEVLATTTPGIREIITIGKPIFDVARGTWDIVIVDGAPTGQISSYVGAPRTISSLVPAGRVRDQARWMEEMLVDGDQTGLVMVSLLEELPVRETREALDVIGTGGFIHVAGVVANRVLDPLDLPAPVREDLPPGPHRDAAELHSSLCTTQHEWLRELEPDWTLPYLFGLLTPTEVAARLADRWDELEAA